MAYAYSAQGPYLGTRLANQRASINNNPIRRAGRSLLAVKNGGAKTGLKMAKMPIPHCSAHLPPAN